MRKTRYLEDPQSRIGSGDEAKQEAGAGRSWVSNRPVPVFNAPDMEGEALQALIRKLRQAEDAVLRPEPKRLAAAEAVLAAWPVPMRQASRLARDLAGELGIPSYPREELVAELGAVLLGYRLEIGRVVANHATYLAS